MCDFHKYLHAYPALLRARQDGMITDPQWSDLCGVSDFSEWLKQRL